MKNRNQSVSLLHPFSAEAIGIKEYDLNYSHSKAQELALQKFQRTHQEFNISIDYFTGKILPYQKTIHNLPKKFWPVTTPLFTKRHRWRKQESFWHYKYQQRQPVDVTIINMSGHGSKYSFELAQLIKKQGLVYIPMIGGLHMSTHAKAREYYRNAHHIIVHTQLQKEALQKKDVFQDLDIRVLPLGIDVEKFKPSFNNREEIEGNYRILFVGRITRLKRIELAIKVVDNLIKNKIQVTLDIIGFIGDKDYYQELNLKIKKLGISNNIHFLGTIEQESLVGHYQDADLLLLPSEHESFGMVMVEAMACGTPVAGIYGSGGPEEIIDAGLDGILSSMENYSATILEYFNNSEQQISIRKAARKKVLNMYSIDATYQVLKTSIYDAQ